MYGEGEGENAKLYGARIRARKVNKTKSGGSVLREDLEDLIETTMISTSSELIRSVFASLFPFLR